MLSPTTPPGLWWGISGNNISPYLRGMFSYAVDITGLSGSNLYRLFVPTNYGKQSLAFRGTAIWNSLPKALY